MWREWHPTWAWRGWPSCCSSATRKENQGRRSMWCWTEDSNLSPHWFLNNELRIVTHEPWKMMHITESSTTNHVRPIKVLNSRASAMIHKSWIKKPWVIIGYESQKDSCHGVSGHQAPLQIMKLESTWLVGGKNTLSPTTAHVYVIFYVNLESSNFFPNYFLLLPSFLPIF